MQIRLRDVTMHLKLWGADRAGVEERVADLVSRLALAPLCGLPVQSFSRGQRYKTALAGLLAVDPELWLLDEPFASGMDPRKASVSSAPKPAPLRLGGARSSTAHKS